MATSTPRRGFLIAALSAAVAADSLWRDGLATARPLVCPVGETQKLVWPPVGNPSYNLYRVWVALDGGVAAIGTSSLDPGAFGRAYIAEFDKSWGITATLYGNDSTAVDKFGYAVSVSGTIAVVGAPRDDNAGGADAGSVYVFAKTADVWNQTAKLTANDAQAGDQFGSAVVLEGNVLLVGAPTDDDQAANAGSVYVFGHDGTAWIQQQKLLPPAGTPNHQFGSSLALDGANAVIGTNFNGAGTGEALVFTFDGTKWVNAQTLLPPFGASFDFFGSAVAISGDWIAVGSPGVDMGFQLDQDVGAVYAFFFDGASWTFKQKLMQPANPESNDYFGSAVAMEGSVLIIGCSGDNVSYYAGVGGYVSNAGSAYQYAHNGTSWVFQHQFRAKDKGVAQNANHNNNDYLGGSAAIDNGTVLLSETDQQYFDSCGVARVGAALFFDVTPDDCDGNGVADVCDPDCNNNLIADVCDFATGFSSDCNGNSVPDECESPFHYQLDDGTATAYYGYTCSPIDLLLLNQFTVSLGHEHITHIAVPWSAAAPANLPATVLLYNDPNNDGNPNDAVLLASASASNIDEFFITPNVTFTTYRIPRTYVGKPGSSFFIGFMASCPLEAFIAWGDVQGSTQGRSWYLTVPLGTADINAIGNNTAPAALMPAAWMFRALALDCNGNGVWDQCDIDSGFSIDSNANGIPDECEAQCRGSDTNGDGHVNVHDLLTVINGWGTCPSPPQTCAADVTGDGSVNTADVLRVVNDWGPCL